MRLISPSLLPYFSAKQNTATVPKGLLPTQPLQTQRTGGEIRLLIEELNTGNKGTMESYIQILTEALEKAGLYSEPINFHGQGIAKPKLKEKAIDGEDFTEALETSSPSSKTSKKNEIVNFDDIDFDDEGEGEDIFSADYNEFTRSGLVRKLDTLINRYKTYTGLPARKLPTEFKLAQALVKEDQMADKALLAPNGVGQTIKQALEENLKKRGFNGVYGCIFDEDRKAVAVTANTVGSPRKTEDNQLLAKVVEAFDRFYTPTHGDPHPTQNGDSYNFSVIPSLELTEQERNQMHLKNALNAGSSRPILKPQVNNTETQEPSNPFQDLVTGIHELISEPTGAGKD